MTPPVPRPLLPVNQAAHIIVHALQNAPGHELSKPALKALVRHHLDCNKGAAGTGVRSRNRIRVRRPDSRRGRRHQRITLSNHGDREACKNVDTWACFHILTATVKLL